jgi:hypothetical protein
MNLTAAQQTTLKTDANGQGTLTAAIAAHNWTPCVAFYNANGPTAVWRNNVRNSEVVANIVASAYIALTALQQKALDLYIGPDIVDATSANVRAGFSSIFGAGATLTNLTAVAQRTGTRLEILLASVVGPPAICGIDAGGASLFSQQIDELTFQRAMGF